MEKTHAVYQQNEDRPLIIWLFFGIRGGHHNLSCMLCYLWFL